MDANIPTDGCQSLPFAEAKHIASYVNTLELILSTP